MKKKMFFLILLFLCLFGGTAYAAPVSENLKTGSMELTEENRYDPVYYQTPEEVCPSNGGGKFRSAREGVNFEECLVNGWEGFQDKIDVSAYNIPESEAVQRYFQVLNNHPSIFYVDNYVRWGSNAGIIKYFSVTYTDTQANVAAQKEAFQRELEKALEYVDPSMAEVEKALAVHDYLVLECEYDYERYLTDINTVPPASHTAYGALVSKIAVCDGYAKAYASIMQELGIDCTIVSSDAMSHAWNLVSLGGKWYHVDATWDDPTWDRVGRVSHSYFLLSDAVISDAGHKHTGWGNNGCVADSTLYDKAFWSSVGSAICYYQGDWYYAQYSEGTSLMKKTELLGSQEEAIYTDAEPWNGYLPGYICLDLAKDKLYFNTRTDIRRLEEDGTATVVYGPSLSGNQLVFGFTVREAESDLQLCYALQGTPNLAGKQTVYSHILLEITGITAENLEVVYDGLPKQITVQGTKEGDSITYKVNGIYQAQQPVMKDAGTYQVGYKVLRNGSDSFFGTAQVVIKKAKPAYDIPEGLKGSSGSLLGSVKLPTGFTWETDTNTELVQEGEYTYQASYTPEDTNNYETVPNISVKVVVNCPGHQYESKVTVEPTTTQKGEKQFNCKICKDTYTEEIETLLPDGTEKPGDTENPGETENPGDTEKPDNTEKPGETENPGDTENPGGTEDPDNTEKPDDTENPGGTEKPDDTQEPGEPENPDEEDPGNTEEPGGSEDPGNNGDSGNAGNSGITGKPGNTTTTMLKKATGLKVRTASATSLKFTWKKVQGVKYQLTLYKGAAKVSQKNTGNSAYTFKKLKPATIYTLKVTPYLEANGRNLYASGDTAIKSATAPEKPKLVSVKKTGKAKGKAAWKKVAGADGYEVSMRVGKGSYKTVKEISKGNKITFTKSGLKKGKSYSFRIRAYKKVGTKKVFGNYSNAISFKLK